MENIFSNRELAFALWSITLLIWGATKDWFRSSLVKIGRASLQPQVVTVFAGMATYVVLMVLALHRAGLWEPRQLKDTILWALFVAAASLFRLTEVARDSSYFLDTIKDNLKLIVFIEFIVGVFVFSLPVELLLVPLMTLLALLLVVSERDQKLSQLTKVLNSITIIVGAWLVIHAIYSIAANFRAFSSPITLADFAVTPILTLCFIPFLFVAARFSHQQLLTTKLRQAIKQDTLRQYAYRKAMLRFRFRVALLDRWAISLFSRTIEDQRDVDLSIDRILKMKSIERDPPLVPAPKGWSPYAAKDFLKSEGFKTGYYTTLDDKEWYAYSPAKDVTQGSLSTISYCVEGDASVATVLKLELSVYQAETPSADLAKFTSSCKALYEAAMQSAPPEDLELTQGRWVVGNREIRIQKKDWTHRSGFDLEFSIGVVASVD